MKGWDFHEASRHTRKSNIFMSKNCYPELVPNTYHNPTMLGGIIEAGCGVVKFFQRMPPIHKAVGSLFEDIDRENYNHYNDGYNKFMANTPLSTPQLHPECLLCSSRIISRIVDWLHRDTRDTSDGCISDICFGDFEGGYLKIPQLYCS